MKVAVVFQHTCIYNVGHLFTVKGVKVAAAFKSFGDFNATVTPEVKENDAVAVFNSAHGNAVLGDYERREILVNNRTFAAVGFNCIHRAGKLASFAQHVCLPAFFHHSPVRFIPVNSNIHTSAAGSDHNIKVLAAQSIQKGFKGVYIVQGGGFPYVPSV